MQEFGLIFRSLILFYNGVFLFQEATKNHFWYDHFDFSAGGGAPCTLFIPWKGPLVPFFRG